MDRGMLCFSHLNFAGPLDYICGGCSLRECELHHPLGMPCKNPCQRRYQHEGACVCESCIDRVIQETPETAKEVINLHTLLMLRQCEYHDPQAREASAMQRPL